jgi:hypothetical protein
VGHAVYGAEKSCAYRFWYGNLKEMYHLEDPGLYGRIIVKWIIMT